MKKWFILCSGLSVLGAVWVPSVFAEALDRQVLGDGIEEILAAPYGTVVSLGNILVSPSRLPGGMASLSDASSHVTVLTQKEIQQSHAKTLPELLRFVEGVFLYDAVGNQQDVTLGLRGFSEGEDVLVLVDGVKLNEPDANNVLFPLIPLDTVERIEIVRGTSSAIYGDGVFSGVVHVITKRPPSERDAFYEGSYTYGSDQAYRLVQSFGGKAGPTHWFLSHVRDLSDGYRSNGGSRGTFIDAKWDYASPGENFLWRFLVKNTDESLQNPGVLTAEEMAGDRRQTANPNDGREIFMSVASTDIEWRMTDGLALRSHLFYRDQSIDFVTTSRTFPTVLGTDELITDTYQKGTALELDGRWRWLSRGHRVILGSEWDASMQDDERYDKTGSSRSVLPTTSRVTDKKTAAAFAQYEVELAEAWRLNGGVRLDDVRFNFVDELDSTANRKNHFSEASPKAGIVFQPHKDLNFFGSVSHSFKSPSISDLFAFPDAGGSNPDLGPEKGESFEGGVRFSLGDRLRGSAAYFRINLRDEIRFDSTDTSADSPFGRFTNVAKTRRQGAEFSLKGSLWRLEHYLTYTFTEATLRSGGNSGKTLTLVPRNQVAWGSLYRGKGKWVLGYDAFYVGDQFVTGDDANAKSPLENYCVTGAHLLYAPREDVEFFFRVNNLFDTLYSTRAVVIGFSEVFPTGTVFFNPAPERNAAVGMRVRF
ncbi:MAG: TonB-dependent receptor [Candidatus Omnitrophota bacterium]